jgi:hypothetical protein
LLTVIPPLNAVPVKPEGFPTVIPPLNTVPAESEGSRYSKQTF